jgi:hypothetical protein
MKENFFLEGLKCLIIQFELEFESAIRHSLLLLQQCDYLSEHLIEVHSSALHRCHNLAMAMIYSFQGMIERINLCITANELCEST